MTRTSDLAEKGQISPEYPLVNLPVAAVLPRKFKWKISIERTEARLVLEAAKLPKTFRSRMETEERFVFKAEKLPKTFRSQRLRSYIAEPVRKVC